MRTPNDEVIKLLERAAGVKIHVPTAEERAQWLAGREERQKAYVLAKGHDCYDYIMFVATPGGHALAMCDLCGDQMQSGGWAAPSDPTWEEFLARTPGEYTRLRLLRNERASKTRVAAKGHDCEKHTAFLLNEDVVVCKLCGDEMRELPL